MKIACPVLLCVFASPALAECPRTGDLATGIRAMMSDGTYEDYRDLGPGLVEMIGTYEDGYVARNLLGQGVYVVELSDLEDGKIVPDSRTTYSYPVDVAELPIPQPGARWTGETAGRDYEGFFAETQSHTWGAMTRATYGACSYDLIVGRFAYSGDGYSYKEEIHYLPELGIGLLASYADDIESEADVYTYVGIEKLKN